MGQLRNANPESSLCNTSFSIFNFYFRKFAVTLSFKNGEEFLLTNTRTIIYLRQTSTNNIIKNISIDFIYIVPNFKIDKRRNTIFIICKKNKLLYADNKT